MRRMGLPVDRALGWLDAPGVRKAIQIEGAFTELTEDEDFDREQARRLQNLSTTARDKGVSLGRLPAASGDGLARPNPDVFLDRVRPGLALYGGSALPEARARGELKP